MGFSAEDFANIYNLNSIIGVSEYSEPDSGQINFKIKYGSCFLAN